MSTPRKSASASKRASAPKGSRTQNRKTEAHHGNGVAVSDEAVAQLAHQLFVDRGMLHGYDVDDWLEAERRLRVSATA